MRIPIETTVTSDEGVQLALFEDDRYKYRIFYTTLRRKAHEVIREYDKRADVENLVGEAKREGLDAIPSSRFKSNYAYFQIVMLAYNIWRYMKILAATLLHKAVLSEGCLLDPPVLHADNGGPQKGFTMRAKLEDLGVTPSYSRPRVSNDNPYSESLFRTFKYRPEYPVKGFDSIDKARQWVRHFVGWYNEEHRHSAIRYVTPSQRHRGEDHTILANRHKVYQLAKQKRPDRWSAKSRNWEPVQQVWLNCPKDDETQVTGFSKVA